MLPDSSEVLAESRPLRLPLRGTTYEVPAPPAAVGRDLMRMIAAGIMSAAGEDLPEEALALLGVDFQDVDMASMCLSRPVYESMVAAGLSQPELELAVGTAFMCWTVSHEQAEAYWRAGGKAPGLTGRPAPPPTGTPTPAAEASTTRNSGSRSGTRSSGSRRGSRSGTSSRGTRG